MQGFDDLKAMSREDLVAAYNREAQHAQASLNFWLDELRRRDSDETEARMLKLTKIAAFAAVGSLVAGVVATVLAVFVALQSAGILERLG